MTGFSSRQGEAAGQAWIWEIRSVNGKGFDLRLRLPEIEGLEAAARAAVARVASRGNITLSLRLTRNDPGAGLQVSEPGLAAALAVLGQIEGAARGAGVTLAPTTAAEVLALQGVVVPRVSEPAESDSLRAGLFSDLEELLHDFATMRSREGAEIGQVIRAQVDRIAGLTDSAARAAQACRPETEAALLAALARVASSAPGADPQRVAQELALLAVKSDVTEEIDRLRAHVTTARALLAGTGPVGRKLDFLTQEFVREANTLCAKSASPTLTAIGLDLKHAIDQMREQVQNVE
ncbi:YicC/YloC family endoribonuclease [Paenirhodobacter sp.]|uniref:YicC/YloC family endoribonuclease n=1 Tax=Paenirhodobacter sp. TaxID=1965326 RepID=UPI003B42439D